MPTAKTLTLQQIVAKLDFSPEDTITAAAEQPSLFFEAAKHRVAALRNRVEAEMQFKKTSANIALAFRAQAKDSGEKITEASLAERVLMQPKVAAAAAQLHKAEEDEEMLKLLLEAFRMRRDSYKAIGELASSGFRRDQALAEADEQLSGLRDKIKEIYPGG